MKLYKYIVSILIVAAMQLTDYKILDIKFGDVLSLYCVFVFIILITHTKLPKFYFQLILVFFLLFLFSLISALYIKFYLPPNINFLKKPVILSISRYLQYTGCVCFSFYVFKFFSSSIKNSDIKIFTYIDKLMIVISFFFALIFLLSWIGIESPFIYSGHRLRGGYVEGGPFGLFIGYYLILRYLVFEKFDRYTILFLILIIFSESKAAIIFMLFFYVIYLLIEGKLKIYNIFILLMMGSLFYLFINYYYNFNQRILSYWTEYNNIKYYISLRGDDDPSLVMGRIAAMHIAPNIIKDNPILGVGMGNYSLVRNNLEYLQGLPRVVGWDLSGLGGIFNTVIESGFLGLLILLIPFIYLWRKYNSKIIKHGIVLFFLAQIFGVQLYFQYIWFGLGLCFYLGIKNQSELKNEKYSH